MTVPVRSVEQAKATGAALLASGYFPVPIYDGKKRPKGDNWREFAKSGRFKASTGATNIGILTDGLRAVDIDVDAPEIAARVEKLVVEMLGTAPRRFRTNSSRVTYLFRAAEGEPEKKRIQAGSSPGDPAVEVLGAGQQIQVWGNHPTGATVQWEGFVPRDSLPKVTEAQIDDFLTVTAAIIGAPPYETGRASRVNKPAPSGLAELKALDATVLGAIVSQIPNDGAFDDRGDWIAMAHAIAAAFADCSDVGRDLWLAFCKRRKVPQREGEPERVWDSLDGDHQAGTAYLLNQASKRGIDVSPYALLMAQSEFEATGGLEPPPLKVVVWPEGFRMTGGGLLYFAPGETDAPPLRVSGPFEIMAETRDAQSERWGLLLGWKDADGQSHSWAMPKAMIHAEGGAIASELESLGLPCTPGRGPQGLLRRALGGAAVTRRLTCVDRLGWHHTSAGAVFVMAGGQTFGPAADSIVLQRETAKMSEAFTKSGTLQDWKDQVGRYAVGNSRLLLFISAALAGPLLDVVTESSGGIHLFGKSQSGKSTAAFAAGSVWGKGDRGAQVRSWRATANGLEGVAAECSDTVLILDELGQADSRDVGDIVYSIANESGKARATRDGAARRRRTWRVMMLSTGEITLAEKLAGAGQRVHAGQEVRLATLPSDAGVGLGAFEKLHDMPSAAALADHIRTATRRFYGTAGRAFLAKLVEFLAQDATALAEEIRKGREAFLKKHLPAGADGQVGSIGSRFALVAVAGELAARWGAVPWTPGEATQAASTCFRAFLGERGDAGAGEDMQAIAQVRAFIEAHGESRFTRLSTDPLTHEETAASHLRTVNRAGYVRDVQIEGEGVTEYLILPEAWRNEVCKGINAKRAAVTLLAAGLLRGEENRGTTHYRIPGSDRIRVYALSGKIMRS